MYLSSNRWTNFLENCKDIYCLYVYLSSCFYPQARDYCSSFYLGLPYVRLRPMDGVLRAAARLIGGVPKFGHIGEFNYWLPVCHRTLYRVSTNAWCCILALLS